jgi:hypothetical protein
MLAEDVVGYGQMETTRSGHDNCIACYSSDLHPSDMRRLGCGHNYCFECLRRLFANSVKNESLFPPRCCRIPIPLFIVEAKMPQHEITKCKMAEVEFGTPWPDRIYCSNRNCTSFIPRMNITKTHARCPSCKTSTCTKCKNGYHSSESCSPDSDLQETLELSAREGWKRCASCGSMVERIEGCLHMTYVFSPLHLSSWLLGLLLIRVPRTAAGAKPSSVTSAAESGELVDVRGTKHIFGIFDSDMKRALMPQLEVANSKKSPV